MLDQFVIPSQELTAYKTRRNLCQDCRYYLRFNGKRDDECVNIDSPKYDISISEFDSCTEWEERR
jgi:hypothetical protein